MISQHTVLLFGANGFIGQHLVRRILEDTDWHVIAADLSEENLLKYKENPRLEFHICDITSDHTLIRNLIERADVVLPFAGIATPKIYITDPLRVHEVDFEANLAIVRLCVELNKRLIWPSTSEVYGMSSDIEFHPEQSNLVMGPIDKLRWIYASGKSLMDRIIYAYGRDKGLQYTIFRPFNWIGYGQDDIHAVDGSPRVITQFLGNILRGEQVHLVDGGENRRSFTYIDDAIDALFAVIENKDGIAAGKIYNIGNPKNNHSIKEVAEMMFLLAPEYPFFSDRLSEAQLVEVLSETHYGEGYQDMINRTPFIANTQVELDWEPRFTLKDSLEGIFAAYVEQLTEERNTNTNK
jgi:nucleoside-diphosphate-sugar epimerase